LKSRLFLLIFATKTVKRRKKRKFHEKEEMEEAFSEKGGKGGKGGAFTSQAIISCPCFLNIYHRLEIYLRIVSKALLSASII
jgi:hypothetical protein